MHPLITVHTSHGASTTIPALPAHEMMPGTECPCTTKRPGYQRAYIVLRWHRPILHRIILTSRWLEWSWARLPSQEAPCLSIYLHKGPPRCPDWQWLHANLLCPRKKTIASTVSDFPITHESEHGMVRCKAGQSAAFPSLVPGYSAVPELITTWHRPMRACGRAWLVGALSHPATRFSSAKRRVPIRMSGRIGACLAGDDQMLNVNTAVSTPGLVLAAKDWKFSAD